MATIELTDDRLIVHLHGFDPLLALRMRVDVPLEHVKGVRAHPEEADFDAAAVEPGEGTGLFLGGRIALGTLPIRDGLAFYEVRDKKSAIAIDLHHERFTHILVEVDGMSPEEACARLEAELSAFRERWAKKGARTP